MPWLLSLRSKSPFGTDEGATEHMVALLAKEAEHAGRPLSDEDKKILCRQASRRQPVPDELRQKAMELIAGLLKKEESSAESADPKSFNGAFEWAGDPGYSNIVALTEEVICSDGFRSKRLLSGWERIKDATQLIGCGLAVVLFMFAVVAFFAWLSWRK